MTPCRICSALPVTVELADPNLVKHPDNGCVGSGFEGTVGQWEEVMKEKVEMSDWQPIEEAPEDVVLETKIDDVDGVRNIQKLVRRGRLWFAGGTYVYYTPTHFRLPS